MKKQLLFIGAFFLLLITTTRIQSQTLWGTTPYGGANYGGTIYNVNPNGSGFNVVFSFSSPEGFTPMGDLLQASDGKLYGTCFNGGGYGSCTVYRYEPQSGTYGDIYDFNIIDGDYPTSGMVQAPDGMLYGAASSGGSSYSGVIYSVDIVNDIYTDIFDFNSSTGSMPYCRPALIGSKLYGTTVYGGANSAGVIYSYDIYTDTYTDEFDFAADNGSAPFAALLLASDGKLYGTTSTGGSYNKGTLFSFDPYSGAFTSLHNFQTGSGAVPKAELMQGSDGKLYGTTSDGGVASKGVIFSFDPIYNVYTPLFHFDGANGATPLGRLTQASGNKLCGATSEGGDSNMGVAFTYDLTNSMYTALFAFTNATGYGANGGFTTLSTETGTATASADYQMVVYPNPVAEGYVTVHSDNNLTANAYVMIKNVDGRVIDKVLLQNADQRIAINLSGGIYLLEVWDNEQVMYSQKISVVR